MSGGDSDLIAALRAGIDAYAEAEGATLLAEAQIEARAKARDLLVEAIAERLLDRAEQQLGRPAHAGYTARATGAAGGTGPREPAPRTPDAADRRPPQPPAAAAKVAAA